MLTRKGGENMPERPWRRSLRRYLRRPGRGRGVPALFLTTVVALLTAWGVITILTARLRPIVRNAAQYQIQNRLVAALEEEITREIAAYDQLINIERDEQGRIVSLIADTAALALLRGAVVEGVLDALNDSDAMEVEVPLGSLLDAELIWGRGPAVRVRSTVLGTVSAEFKSDFSSAGLNQTLHRIWLDVSLPVRLFLPGGPVDLSVETQLTVAETVIVGEIPDFFLASGLQNSFAS